MSTELRDLILNPNLSITLARKCNAKCSFCFADYSKLKDVPKYDDYFISLVKTLSKLPDNFEKISLTGAEPTLSPYFDIVLDTLSIYRKKYKFVVLSTNGTGLKKFSFIKKMAGIVDAVNISRHHYDDEENYNVFKTRTIPSTIELKKIVINCKSCNISPSLSIVITKDTTKEFLDKFFEYAKSIGISDVRVRHIQEQNCDVERHGVELLFDEKILDESRCPVCRHTFQKIQDMNITWVASTLEPSQDWDVIYEAIFQQNADLTIDWCGETIFDID